MRGVTDAPSSRLSRATKFWNDMAEEAFQALLDCGSLDALAERDENYEYALIQTLIELLKSFPDVQVQLMLHRKIWGALEPPVARQLLILAGRDVLTCVETHGLKEIGLLAADGIALHALDYERQGCTISFEQLPDGMRLFIERRRAAHSFESDPAPRTDDARGKAMVESLRALAFGNPTMLTQLPETGKEREAMTLLCQEELERFFLVNATGSLLALRALGKRIYDIAVEMEMIHLPFCAQRYLFAYLCDQGCQHGGNHLCDMLGRLQHPIIRSYEVHQSAAADDADTKIDRRSTD